MASSLTPRGGGARNPSRLGLLNKSSSPPLDQEQPSVQSNASASTRKDYKYVGSSANDSCRSELPRHMARPGAGLVDLEMCEEYLATSVRDLGREVLKCVRVEFQQVMEELRGEIRDVKCTVGPAFVESSGEVTLTAMLTQVLDKTSQLLKEASRPVNVDFTAIREEIRNSEMMCLDVHRDLTQRLEDRVTQNVIHKVKLGADMEALLHRSEKKLRDISTLQLSMNTDFANTAKDVQTVQSQNDRFQAHLDLAFDAQLTKHLREQVVCVDFNPVLVSLSRTHQAVNVDFQHVLGEIGKIQQALNVDFMEEDVVPRDFCSQAESRGQVSSVGDVLDGMDRGTSFLAPAVKRTNKRKRDYPTQTDNAGTEEVSCQTDESLGKQKEKRVSEKASEKRIKAQQLRQAEKDKNKFKPVFADAEAMKVKVRQKQIKRQYNVMDLYKDAGSFQLVARSLIFENITFAVILLNTVWIAVDADHNDAAVLIQAHPVFQVVENLFCTYFTFELVIRFGAFKLPKYCLKDGWFVFDSFLVFFMIVETWLVTLFMVASGSEGSTGFLGNASILKVARMIKITRVARMARLLRAIPEIVILLKGIGAAARSVCSFIVLWLIIIYIFAVVFRQITNDSPVGEQYFKTIPDAMNSLMLEGVLPDNARLVNDLAGANPLFFPIIMIFVLLASLTLMYMLIGVLVDVISCVATTEKEGLTVRAVASQLREVFQQLERDADASLSKMEFQKLLEEPEIITIMQDVNVDVVVLMEMSALIYEDNDKEGTGITFEKFVEIVLRGRGSNQVTVKDVNAQLRAINASVANCVNCILVNISSEFARLRVDVLHNATGDNDSVGTPTPRTTMTIPFSTDQVEPVLSELGQSGDLHDRDQSEIESFD